MLLNGTVERISFCAIDNSIARGFQGIASSAAFNLANGFHQLQRFFMTELLRAEELKPSLTTPTT